MILVTGGMAQGKREFAHRLAPSSGSWTDGSTVDWDTFMSSQFCFHFHAFVRRVLERKTGPDREERDAARFSCRETGLWTAGELMQMEDRLVESLFAGNYGKILITDEIGCGIVPVDPFERMYREETGRICCRIAAGSKEVWRVCCGLGQRIK